MKHMLLQALRETQNNELDKLYEIFYLVRKVK